MPILVQAIWWIIFLAIATGVLMLSYWIIIRQPLAFQRALVVQLGLFLVNLVLSALIGWIPLREILWLLIAAYYFKVVLALSFVQALLITLLQRLLYFLFVMALFAPVPLARPL